MTSSRACCATWSTSTYAGGKVRAGANVRTRTAAGLPPPSKRKQRNRPAGSSRDFFSFFLSFFFFYREITYATLSGRYDWAALAQGTGPPPSWLPGASSAAGLLAGCSGVWLPCWCPIGTEYWRLADHAWEWDGRACMRRPPRRLGGGADGNAWRGEQVHRTLWLAHH